MSRRLARDCEDQADQLRLLLDAVQEGCLMPASGGPSRPQVEAALLDAIEALHQLDAVGCSCHEGSA